MDPHPYSEGCDYGTCDYRRGSDKSVCCLELNTKNTDGITLPDGVNHIAGMYTKEKSDLFIDADITPDDLRRIANHMEANKKKGKIS